MSLPASGQIRFSDVATEMEQTGYTAAQYNYWISVWGRGYASDGYPYNGGFNLTPINVHSSNTGKYSTATPFRMSDWYGYNRNASYACDGTSRSLFFSFPPTAFCYSTSMIQFDAGTTSRTLTITIDGTSSDFSYVGQIVVFYGKPWQSNSLGLGNSSVVYSNNIQGGALNTSFNYSYTYDSNKGQYIYVVIYGICP